MLVNVVMLAFQPEVQIYPIDVPMKPEEQKAFIQYMNKKTSDGIIYRLLSRLFLIGNSDDRPHGKLFCSVSAGDVALIANEMWLCCSVGWRKITVEQMNEYCKMDRRDRSSMAFDLSEFEQMGKTPA